MSDSLRRRLWAPQPQVMPRQGTSLEAPEIHRDLPPDGPILTAQQARHWRQHIQHSLEAGQWGELVRDLWEHLGRLAIQQPKRVSLDRPWPSGVVGPPVKDLRLHMASCRALLHLERGQYWLAARALADQAATEQEQAERVARHAAIVAQLGHLPPHEIEIADLVSDPHVMKSLDRRRIESVAELVSLPTRWLHQNGITRARLRGLVADLDRHHIRHSFDDSAPDPKRVTQHQRKLLSKDRRAGKAAPTTTTQATS